MSKKFVPVMITPYTPQAQIDFDMLKKLIDFYLAAGVKGLFANCLSSEMFGISDDEKIALTAAVVKHVNGRVPVVATGSFGDTIEKKADFAKRIHDTGINSVILITSHYATAEESDEQLQKNLEKMLALTGNIQLGLYECPVPYKRLLTPAILKALAATGRMSYHKDTCCNEAQIKAKLDAIKGLPMEFYDAHTPHGMSSMKAGAQGMSAISGNFYPEVLVWLCENVNNPDKQEDVAWIQQELTKVDPQIHVAYPMSSKFFLQLRGLPIHTVSRIHPKEATEQQKAGLHSILDTAKTWFDRLKIKEVRYEDVIA